MRYCNPINYTGIKTFVPLYRIGMPKIEIRKKVFIQNISKFVSEYSRDMLNEFYKYWSEENKSGKKMRFELERTWQLDLRLSRWHKYQKDDNRGHGTSMNQITN